MSRLFLTLFALVLLIAPGVAFAQEGENFKLTHEQIDEIGKFVHGNLAGAKISNGELIGEERAKTLKYPLVPYDLMEFVILRGHIAGFAAHCKLDWQGKFYVPLMKGLRAKQKDYTDYQWAFVGMLHGASMKGAEESMKGEACEEKMKDNLMKAALE